MTFFRPYANQLQNRGTPAEGSQPQSLDVLDAGQDHIAAATGHTRQGVYDPVQKDLHFFGGSGDGVNVQLVLSRYAVDLCDGIVLTEDLGDLGQTPRRCFDFKIA